MARPYPYSIYNFKKYIFSGEEEAMDHQGSPNPESSQSETVDGEDETSEPENGPAASASTEKTCSSRPKLFSFSMVNSYGTANISPLAGNVLKLTCKCDSPPRFLLHQF